MPGIDQQVDLMRNVRGWMFITIQVFRAIPFNNKASAPLWAKLLWLAAPDLDGKTTLRQTAELFSYRYTETAPLTLSLTVQNECALQDFIQASKDMGFEIRVLSGSDLGGLEIK